MGACLLQDSKCANDQEVPQVSVTLLANGAQTLFAAGRIFARDDADPGGEVTSRLEHRNIRNRGHDGARAENTDARISFESFAVVAFTMDEKSLDDSGDLSLVAGDLCDKRGQAGPPTRKCACHHPMTVIGAQIVARSTAAGHRNYIEIPIRAPQARLTRADPRPTNPGSQPRGRLWKVVSLAMSGSVQT